MSLFPPNLLECFSSTNAETGAHTHTHAGMCVRTHIALCIFLLMSRIKRMFFPPSVCLSLAPSERECSLTASCQEGPGISQMKELPGPPRDAEDTNTHTVTHAVTNRNSCTHTHCAQKHTYTGKGTYTHMHGET